MEQNQDLTGSTVDSAERMPSIRGMRSGRNRGLAAAAVLVVALLVGGTTALATSNDSDGGGSGTGAEPASMVELMDQMHNSPEAQAMHERLSPELRADMEEMHAQMREMHAQMGEMMGQMMGGQGQMMGGQGEMMGGTS